MRSKSKTDYVSCCEKEMAWHKPKSSSTLGFTIQFDYIVKPISCLSLIWRVIAVLLFAANAKPSLIQTQTNCVLTSDSPALSLASGLHQIIDVAPVHQYTESLFRSFILHIHTAIAPKNRGNLHIWSTMP